MNSVIRDLSQPFVTRDRHFVTCQLSVTLHWEKLTRSKLTLTNGR